VGAVGGGTSSGGASSLFHLDGSVRVPQLGALLLHVVAHERLEVEGVVHRGEEHVRRDALQRAQRGAVLALSDFAATGFDSKPGDLIFQFLTHD
jgi:hypothetical protein